VNNNHYTVSEIWFI